MPDIDKEVLHPVVIIQDPIFDKRPNMLIIKLIRWERTTHEKNLV